MSRFSLIVFFALLVVLAGCHGIPTPIQTPAKQSGETVLGETEGNAMGIMLFNIIPIKQNQRFDRAYKAALAKHPGAKRLTNIVISEDWYWAFVLNLYSFKITGTAVK